MRRKQKSAEQLGWDGKVHRPADYLKRLVANKFTLLITVIILGAALFHEPMLIGYWNWLRVEFSEFESEADVLVYMDIRCQRLDEAAKLVQEGKAALLYSFDYDDWTCKKQFDAAVEKYALKDRALWGGISDTSFGAVQSFHNTMESQSIPHSKIYYMSISPAMRRISWAFRENLGKDVQLKSSHGSLWHFEKSNHPRWWTSGYVRRGIVAETQKTVGYWIYYVVLNQKKAVNIPDHNIYR